MTRELFRHELHELSRIGLRKREGTRSHGVCGAHGGEGRCRCHSSCFALFDFLRGFVIQTPWPRLSLLHFIGIALSALFIVQPLMAQADTGPIQRLGNGIPTSIAASPDGKTIAVGSSIGVWFFDAATFAPSGFWDTGTWVKAVQYSADGRYLRADEKVYDTTKGNAVQIDSASVQWIYHRCSFDGKLCEKDILGPDGVTVYSTWIVNQDTGVVVKWLLSKLEDGDEDISKDFAWAPDRKTLYDVNGNAIRALDASTLQKKQALTNFFTGNISQTIWSPNSTEIASDQVIWNVGTGRIGNVRNCWLYWWRNSFSCEAPLMVIDFSHQVTTFDSSSGTRVLSFAPHHIWTISAALNNSAKVLATSGVDLLYDCSDLRNTRTCSASYTSTRIWDTQSGKMLAQFPVLFYNFVLSPDGRLVAGHTLQGVEVWDWKTTQRIWSAQEDISYQCPLTYYGDYDLCGRLSGGVAVDPAGKYVATYAEATGNTARLWRAATGELITTLVGHTAPVSSIAFSPDGSKLAGGSYQDGTILIWPVP